MLQKKSEMILGELKTTNDFVKKRQLGSWADHSRNHYEALCMISQK